MITNLAIKGGGVRGVAYVGALQQLQKYKVYDGIKRVSGTSAGALLACMMCAGYSVNEIEKLMLSIKFKKFETGWNPFRIFSSYGLFSGNYILDFVQRLLNNAPIPLKKNATFLDMKNAGCKELYVFACNVSLHTVTEFSASKTPNTIVAEAIRASMSIPYFFKAWKFSNKLPDDHIYVDGGVVYNYPLSFFDDERFNTYKHVNFDTIGLFLYTKNKHLPTPILFYRVMFFTKQLFESLLETQDFVLMRDKEQMQRSILIDSLNIPATNFNITTAQLNALIESGSNATNDFLAKISNNNFKLD